MNIHFLFIHELFFLRSVCGGGGGGGNHQKVQNLSNYLYM
jgi:hypothetical protein